MEETREVLARRLNILYNLPLFSTATPKLRKIVENSVEFYQFRKNQTIFFESERSKNIHLLLTGRVKAFKTAADGSKTILALYKEGDIVGETEIYGNNLIQTTAVALEDCLLAIVSKAKFHRLLSASRRFSDKVSAVLTRRLKDLSLAIVQRDNLSSADRVSAGLAYADLNNGYLHEGRHFLRITHQEMAEISGVARESVSRTLEAKSRAGEVCLEHNLIVLLK